MIAPVAKEALAALRAGLSADIRVLRRPSGEFEIGGGIPCGWGRGDLARDAEIERDSRAFFRAWRAPASRRVIERAVRLCGVRTHHGWLVLEDRP